jgi:hypothetical protein
MSTHGPARAASPAGTTATDTKMVGFTSNPNSATRGMVSANRLSVAGTRASVAPSGSGSSV